MKVFETIKECRRHGRTLKILRSIEDIYFLYHGKDMIDNSFSLEDVEYLFDLTINGNDRFNSF